MICVICRTGETRPSEVTVPLQRGATIVILKGVPGQVCENCGEYYLSQEVTQQLLARAEEAVQNGAEVEILRYAA
jgi:YgiT-type zinc finger domain-containing protein